MGGGEERGENGWRSIVFKEIEISPVQGCSPSAFAQASASRTTDLTDSDHVRMLNRATHNAESKFWVQRHCPRAFGLAKTCANPNMGARVLEWCPCIQTLAKKQLRVLVGRLCTGCGSHSPRVHTLRLAW